jgi:thiamine-phosphate pyrophosphorylase
MAPLPAFYPILDTEVAARCGIDPVNAAAAMLQAGVRILQFRHKGFLSREIFAQMEHIARLCREAGVIFVVNDRADIARLVGAALHLGQDDLPPTTARAITGADTLIGFSTHNERQLRAAEAEPVDYLALGPIFGTASKENPDPIVGVDELRRLRSLTTHPLVAIGGITRANAREVLHAGANSVAVIGDLFPRDGSLRDRASEWLELVAERI